jgi:hypothetical protein
LPRPVGMMTATSRPAMRVCNGALPHGAERIVA